MNGKQSLWIGFDQPPLWTDALEPMDVQYPDARRYVVRHAAPGFFLLYLDGEKQPVSILYPDFPGVIYYSSDFYGTIFICAAVL